MNRYAAIDVGSNSVLLLVVEKDRKGGARVLADSMISLGTAEGVLEGNRMSQAAVERLQWALGEFAEILRDHEVFAVEACATQLFRTAANGRQVARQLGARFGWNIRVVSGETEARLSYVAAATGLSQVPEERIVVDVGGGSTEIIHGHGERVDFLRSYPVGAVGLSEKHGLTGSNVPALADATAELQVAFADEELRRFPGGRCSILVGGTATTLAGISRSAKDFDPLKFHGVKLSEEWLRQIVRRLLTMSTEERAALMPFDSARAKIIVGGCMIIEQVMNRLRVSEVIVSNRGLRWGLLAERFSLRFDS